MAKKELPVGFFVAVSTFLSYRNIRQMDFDALSILDLTILGITPIVLLVYGAYKWKEWRKA